MMLETPAIDVESRLPARTNGQSHDEYLYLAGRPTLRRFLRFARANAVHPVAESALAAEWEAAHRAYCALEKSEAGFPDHPVMTSLTQFGSRYEPLLTELLKDPLVRYGFNSVPTDVAMVELDRLVVYQKHIDLSFVRSLKAKLSAEPTDEEIFRTCLPFDHPQPPAKWSRVAHGKYVFMSPSNDLRYLETMSLQPGHIAGYPPPGSMVGVVGLAVGFGSNFLNAVYAENRLILNNGSHRAYVLRDLGVTHVPCIVQHASSRAELELVAPDDVRKDPDLFLKTPRPSVLKDYFDPRLHKVFAVHRKHRQITLRFEVEEDFVPAL